MNKWAERLFYVVALAVIVIVIIGSYAIWRDCTDSGGITVRGVFGFECIRK